MAEIVEQLPLPHERQWRRPWQSPFLESLGLIPDVTSACNGAGVARTTAYKMRDSDPEFAAAWDEALDLARDLVQRVAHQWVTTGVPVKQRKTRTVTKTDEKGKTIETTTTVETSESSERSAALMQFWLKAHYPDKYRFAERVESTGADGGPIRVEAVSAIDAQIEKLSAELNRRAIAAGSPPVPIE